MKISTRGRYAIRVMTDLALNGTDSYVKVKEIAQRQSISEKYLEQIISLLHKAGYVNSIRGAKGGYSLNKAPAEYTVGMILRLTEVSLAPVPCLEEEDVVCGKCDQCESIDLWKELYEATTQIVDNITIEDLKHKQAEKLALLEQ